LAESVNDGRQPAADLDLFAAEAGADVAAIAADCSEGLNECERNHLTLGAEIATAQSVVAAHEEVVDALPKDGRPRALATWRLSVQTLAISVALPVETVLTDLSLRFLDVDVSERRLIAAGIALALTLLAVVASHRHDPRSPWTNPALIVVAAVVVSLALLRYGVMKDDTAWWEKAGATLALGAGAAAFAFFAAFVEERARMAVADQAKWLSLEDAKQQCAAAREQLRLLNERYLGLAAEVQSHRDRGIHALRKRKARFDYEAAEWWSIWQVANAAAAPDIRPQLDELRARLEGDVIAEIHEIDARAASLRHWMRGDLPDRQLPSKKTAKKGT